MATSASDEPPPASPAVDPGNGAAAFAAPATGNGAVVHAAPATGNGAGAFAAPATGNGAGAFAAPAPGNGAVVHPFDETSSPGGGHGRLNVERWASLAAAVLRDEGIAAGELGLRFVDPGPMAELNLAHMGAPGPTDVLAFPIDAGDGAGPQAAGPERLLGDVVVCPAYAAAQALDHQGDGDRHRGGHDGSLADEVALLVVHGVLHVLGYDHARSDDAAAMRAREQQLLTAHYRAT